MMKIGIFGNLEARKREFGHLICSQVQDLYRDETLNFTNESLTGYPGDKPVTLLQTEDYEIVEYPHAFYPHRFLGCDLYIIILTDNSYNLVYMASRLKDEVIFVAGEDIDRYSRYYKLKNIVKTENFKLNISNKK